MYEYWKGELMVLVWKGWGVLVMILPVLFGIIIELTLNAIRVEESVFEYGLVYGFSLSAIVCFLLGRKLNDPSNDKELVDPKTGETHMLKIRHTFFWIPMQWWSIAMVLLGVMFAIT